MRQSSHSSFHFEMPNSEYNVRQNFFKRPSKHGWSVRSCILGVSRKILVRIELKSFVVKDGSFARTTIRYVFIFDDYHPFLNLSFKTSRSRECRNSFYMTCTNSFRLLLDLKCLQIRYSNFLLWSNGKTFDNSTSKVISFYHICVSFCSGEYLQGYTQKTVFFLPFLLCCIMKRTFPADLFVLNVTSIFCV